MSDWVRHRADSWNLNPDDVHVWVVDLDAAEDRAPTAKLVLSAEEQMRASRFRFDADRKRFVVSHLAMRIMLARYAGTLPHKIRFRQGTFGKPQLEHISGVYFNLSRSNGLAVFAVSRRDNIGVDIEYLRDILDIHSLASAVLTDPEQRHLGNLKTEAIHEAFLRFWTRKEAILKAVGQGLSANPKDIDVLADEIRYHPLSQSPVGFGSSDLWHIAEIVPGPNYLGALAVPAGNRRTYCWDGTELLRDCRDF